MKNSVIIEPTRAPLAATPARSAASSSPLASRSDSRSSSSYGRLARSSRSIAIPAAIASGFPDSVPAW